MKVPNYSLRKNYDSANIGCNYILDVNVYQDLHVAGRFASTVFSAETSRGE